jgi:hypothetical protein
MHSLYQRTKFILGLLGLIILSGCTSQGTVNEETKNSIVYEILSQARYVNTLFDQCEKLGDDAEIETLSVQQDWLLKNWNLINSADHYLTEKEQAKGILYRGELLSLTAIQIASSAEKRAMQELNFKQRSTNNQQKFCIQRLQKLARDELDMQSHVNIKNLPFVISNVPVSIISTQKVPTMAGSFHFSQPQGRTAYDALTSIKAECPSAELVTVNNDWPLEAYAAYCKGIPSTLIVCEWGTCKPHAN